MTSTLAIDYGSGVSDACRSIATFVPKFVAFVVILVVGWIVAKVLARIVTVVLGRIGFSRLIDRGGVGAALARGDYDASKLLSKVVYYAVLLIALQLAIGVFGPNPVGDILAKIVAWLPKLFIAIAIVIIVVVAAIARAVSELVRGALGSASYGPLLATVASVFLWGAGIVAALNQIGVATTVTTPVLIAVLATIGGIAVVGVGGGLVRPMQSRWDGWLTKVEEEIPARRAEQAARTEWVEPQRTASDIGVPGPGAPERRVPEPGEYPGPEAGWRGDPGGRHAGQPGGPISQQPTVVAPLPPQDRFPSAPRAPFVDPRQQPYPGRAPYGEPQRPPQPGGQGRHGGGIEPPPGFGQDRWQFPPGPAPRPGD